MSKNRKSGAQPLLWLIIGIAVVLLLPAMINWLILQPRIMSYVGTDVDWLMFWGSYLGSVISAGVAFIILYIQRRDNEEQNERNRIENETANEKNRNLQLNILKYQQEIQWLNAFREAGVDYVSSYNFNDLVNVVNTYRHDPETAFNMIAPLLDRLCRNDANLKFIGIRGDKTLDLINTCDSVFELYNDILNDIQYVFTFVIENKNHTFNGFYLQSDQMPISDTMKKIIRKASKVKGLSDDQLFNNIAMARIRIMDELYDKIKNLIGHYILGERKRIEGILTVGIN